MRSCSVCSTSPITAAFPRALSLALEVSEAPAGAAEALGLLLEGFCRSSCPEVAWRSSGLTGDGFPVEIAFTEADASFRYTVDVAGPETDVGERLYRAECLLERLGSPLPEDWSARLRRMQEEGQLRWGVWMGGRHSAEGARFKLYTEVPEGSREAWSLAADRLGAAPLLLRGSLVPRFVGVEPATRRIEIYFRVPRLEVWEVERLLGRTGLAERWPDLRELMERAFERPLGETIPGRFGGFSLSIPSEGPPTFTLFVACVVAFGGDGTTRRRLLELTGERGCRLGDYARVSEPLATRTGPRTAHLFAGFTIAAQGPAVLSVGLRPPEP
jgi:hypothetical protein